MIGSVSLKLLKSHEITEIFKPRQFKIHGSISRFSVGNLSVVQILKEYMRILCDEIKLTSKMETLCVHEIANLKIIMGERGRMTPIVLPNRKLLLSEHYRDHQWDIIQSRGDW